MGFFGILGLPLGYVMKWIYDFIPNYGWAIILFTLLVRVVSFPLQLSQQKTTAKMSVFSPMVQEIQKKYARNPEKQQEEMQRLQEEYGYNPTAGCLPMALNFFVIFGIIEVVYRPLQYVLHFNNDVIKAAVEVIGLTNSSYTAQTTLMQTIRGMSASEALGQFAGVFDAAQIEAIQNFEMTFMGIDLCAMPELSLAKWTLLIFPVLSVVTMILVNVITMSMTGQEMTGSMKMMPWMMSLFFVWFCFKVPVAFSLYYAVSNVLMFASSAICRKIYSPEAAKAQYAEEMKAKKAEKKRKKQITVQDEKTGEEIVKEVSDSELVRIRLEMARKLDAEKYKDERTEPLKPVEQPAAEPAKEEKENA